MNAQIVGSPLLNERFDITALPIQLSDRLDQIDRLSLRKLWAVARNVGATAKALWGRRPDLVYFTLPPHGGGFYSALPLVLLAKLRGAQIVYHFHGKGIAEAAKRSGLFRALFAWATRGAHNILLSQRLYADAEAFLRPEQTSFLANFGPEPSPAAASAGRSGKHILYLSNLVLSKGPIVLLDALALLKARGCDFRASFTGAGFPPLSPERFVAETHARGLEDRVSYVGPIYGQAKQELLDSADIFAFPTWNDAFPLVVLEAMAAGVPVVATPEGAIPDMVEDGKTGFLVGHRDPAALADALQKLLADPALGRLMGAEGQARVATRFSRDEFFSRMAALWDRLIAGPAACAHPSIAQREQS